MIPVAGPDVVTATVPLETPPIRATSLLRRSFRLWRTRIGVVLVGLLVLLAIVGPFVSPYGPSTPVGAPNSLPGGLIVGVIIGLIAAYSRNALDDVLMRAMDVILAFPQIMLALVAVAVVGPAAWVIVVAIALTTVPRIARVARGAALPVVERDFIACAEAMGVPRWRILVGDLLPNTLGPLMVEASLRVTYSVGVIAALAYLGLAPDPNGANWGTMINENQIALVVQPWGAVMPIIAIALLTMGTGLIGDGIARTAAGIDRSRGAE